MAIHSTVVANKFFDLANNVGKSLTQMQLQKLVYIAHGWSLAINKEPLTSDFSYAWEYGPVYTELLEALRSYGSQPITRKIKVKDYGFGASAKDADNDVSGTFSDQQSELIHKVFEVYGKFHAFQLSALTHKKDTPWYEVYEQAKHRRGEIPNKKIEEHFIKIAEDQIAAQTNHA